MEKQPTDGESTHYIASTPRPVRFTFSNATFSTTNSNTIVSTLRISYQPDISSSYIDRTPTLDITKEDLPDEDF